MTISLCNAGKRFNREWIFRRFTYSFTEGNSYAIIGANGSGKSTLLQVIAGAIHMNEGSLVFEDNQPGGSKPAAIPPENFYQYVSFCAPYLELIEEMTLREFLHFHKGFKPLLPGLDAEKIVAILGLQRAANKQIRYYSSGMKQRAKLAQCILSNTPVVLLDEPCTNLDAAGIALYQQLIREYCSNRLVVVSSNDEVEYGFCKERINITDYK
jgi:ABC-type multidrug transport system ATPase subunit